MVFGKTRPPRSISKLSLHGNFYTLAVVNNGEPSTFLLSLTSDP